MQNQWRARFEQNAMRFVLSELEPALDEARREVAAFVGADPADLAFVTNPTTGVGAVLASIAFRPDDEVLITDHGYNACNNAARYWTERAGARVAVARVPFPVRDDGEIMDAILAAVTPKTRFAIVDHVTSPTALVLPIGELVRELQARNVEVLVDGAHSPGMLPLDIASLGAEYFVGTLHKWCCAPKGVSILHVRSDKQSRVHPLVISHGYNSTRTDRSRYHLEFDWVGSHDPSGFLAAPAALRYLAGLLPGGLPGAHRAKPRARPRRSHAPRREARARPSPAPNRCSARWRRCSFPTIRSPQSKPGSPFSEPLTSNLRERHRFEVPVMLWPTPSSRLLRISAGPYNHLAQYERLAEAIRAELF